MWTGSCCMVFLLCSKASVKTALDRYLRAAPMEYFGGKLSAEELFKNPPDPGVANRPNDSINDVVQAKIIIKLKDDVLVFFLNKD